MEFKGTKGDWQIVENNGIIYITNSDIILIAELDTCDTIGFHQTTPKCNYYNSKLIAAAPEMLKALQEVVSCTSKGRFAEAIETSTKAIEKALK